jgi:hypothetical protein
MYGWTITRGGDHVDWDWEDGPPRDTPPSRRAPDEAPAPREPAPFEPEWPDSPDESVTQVVSDDAAWEQATEPEPDESVPHSPPPEYVLPDRTETGRSSAQSDPEFAYLPPASTAADTETGRRPRSPEDRRARREQRRRQLRRRRLVALAILIAIVVPIVVLIVRGCGGSDAGAAATVFVTLFVDRRVLVVPGRM